LRFLHNVQSDWEGDMRADAAKGSGFRVQESGVGMWEHWQSQWHTKRERVTSWSGIEQSGKGPDTPFLLSRQCTHRCDKENRPEPKKPAIRRGALPTGEAKLGARRRLVHGRHDGASLLRVDVGLVHAGVLLTSEVSTAPQYPGVFDSLPYFVLYNNNTDELTTFQTASVWVQTNLVPFGDFDRDHTTTVADIPSMMTALADLSRYKSDRSLNDELLEAFGDINGDGSVNNADVQELIVYLANGGTGDTGLGGGSITAVPEPAAVCLFVAGAVPIWFARRVLETAAESVRCGNETQLCQPERGKA
jgi:hypothetical protein